MASRVEDKDIIFNAYLEYRTCCNMKSTKFHKEGIISYRNEVRSLADKYLFYFERGSLLESEKTKLVNKSKVMYNTYCLQCKCKKEIWDSKTDEKLRKLMSYVADVEAVKIYILRQREVAGVRINLQEIFKHAKYIRLLIINPIEIIIYRYINDRGYTSIGLEEHLFFITASGAKYHLKDCTYCKGRHLTATTLNKIKLCSLEPCKCITSSEIKKENINSPGQNTDTVTVYIDETIRPNKMAELIPSMQKELVMFSYIICKGLLISEREITNENILDSGIGLISGREKKSTMSVAREAIGNVLMKIANEHHFYGDVVIYTDNQAAQRIWNKDSYNNRIGSLFHQVRVYFIPREQNKEADSICRKQSILQVPSDKLDLISSVLSENQTLKKYKAQVERYFSDPEKNIPNLIEELQGLLSAIRKRDEIEGNSEKANPKIVQIHSHLRKKEEFDAICSS